MSEYVTYLRVCAEKPEIITWKYFFKCVIEHVLLNVSNNNFEKIRVFYKR